MEKRYQVFISSTFQDLQNARQEVSQALLRADCFPAGMELFPAADEEQFEFIKTVIDQSDYYIIISAGRYGTIHPETGLSYTEMEYDYAVSIGKPVIRLLHRDPFNELKGEFIEQKDSNREKLGAFRSKLKSKNLVTYWKDPIEIPAEVILAVKEAIEKNPAIGWVRGNTVSTVKPTRTELPNISLRTPQMMTSSMHLATGEIASCALRFPTHTNRFSVYFEELSKRFPEEWVVEFSTQADDLVDFLATNEGEEVDVLHRINIVGALDNQSAVLYYGSIEELTTRILSAPTDTIKAIAQIKRKTFRIGLVRIGMCIVVVYSAQGVGTGIGRAGESLGSFAEQVVRETASIVLRNLKEISEEDSADIGIFAAERFAIEDANIDARSTEQGR